MLAVVFSSTVSGIDAVHVDVEVEISSGKERFIIVGLGDGAVKEAKDRVGRAVMHSGFSLPEQVLVNLSPAELKKEGSSFDLAIALGIIVANRALPKTFLDGRSFHGELGLNGQVRPIRGAIVRAIEAVQRGLREMIVPIENVSEARLISGISVVGVCSLNETIEYLKGRRPELVEREVPPLPTPSLGGGALAGETLSEVVGQETAKRALMIAAAGQHNVLMIGPPGCGKSMLADRFPSLLPELSREELLEAVRIHSLAGQDIRPLLSGRRPVRSPHHSISEHGLIGGGSVPRPGELSLAHNGVLFLDEFPEFSRAALEALRTPLESGAILVSRVKQTVRFPARIQLLAAMNPCPCGRFGTPGGGCGCSRAAIFAYLRKLSQPILDRIDLHVGLQPVLLEELVRTRPKDRRSEELKDDVERAESVKRTRELQMTRQGKLNSRLSLTELSEADCTESNVIPFLQSVQKRLGFSARTTVRLLRVARTISDMASTDRITQAHLAEAISFRSLERLEQHCVRPAA